jgi:hypothetical protein
VARCEVKGDFKELTERLVQPFVFEFLARRYPLAAVNNPRDPRAAANGQYLLVTRALYDAIGAHAAVRGEMLEDVALAGLAKRRGPIAFLATRDLLQVRMYDGARSLVEGWTKNLADLAGGPPAAVAEGLRMLVRGAAPLAALPLGAAAAVADHAALAGALVLLAGLGLSALLAEGVHIDRLGGRPAHEALLAPLGAAATGLLLLWSAYRRSGGREVAWRGRRYVAPEAGGGRRVP